MSQTVDNGPAEKVKAEIKVRSLLFYVVKRWRLILIAALIVAVCILGFSTVEFLLKVSDNEFVDTVAKEYNDQVLDYTDRIQTLEREIEALEDDLVWQQAYNQDSMLMKIDPYHKTVSTMTYYIDADELIAPETTELYISSTDSLMKLYMLYLSGGELYSELLQRFPEMIDIRYIKELVSVVMYDTTGMIALNVIGDEDETAQTIFGIARKGMEDMYIEASESIAEHKLVELDASSYTYQDLSLADRQQSNLEMVFTLNTQIREKKTELETLNDKFKKLSYTPLLSRTAIQSIQNAIYSALLTVTIIMFLLAMYYAASDKIFDPDKLIIAAGLNIVGVIPRASNKHRWLLDKAAAAVGNITMKTSERDAALLLTAKSICQALLAKGLSQGEIALTGSIAVAELQETADIFNNAIKDEKLRFVAMGNPIRDVAAVDGITDSDVTVIVEKQNQSRCTDVLKEMERITAWGKPVLGVVLLDVDAV